MGVIADSADRFENIAELNPFVVPAHTGTVGRVVDGEFQHPGQGAHVPFIQPDTGRTDDTFEY